MEFLAQNYKPTKEDKKVKGPKVVPLVQPKKPQKKSVQFHSNDDVKIINVPAQTPNGSKEELYSLVRQLVLLETEELKAQQFLEFVQKHSCFDKQDQLLIRHFLEQLAHEKKSLLIVLTNYGKTVQPLITMMTIAERRLALLDSTNLITPDSSLHESFLEKQQQLQAVIDQASELLSP